MIADDIQYLIIDYLKSIKNVRDFNIWKEPKIIINHFQRIVDFNCCI